MGKTLIDSVGATLAVDHGFNHGGDASPQPRSGGAKENK